MNYPFHSTLLAIVIFFAALQIIGSMQSFTFLKNSKNSSSFAISSSSSDSANFSQNLLKNSVISEMKIHSGAVANQLFQNASPLNNKGLLDSKVAKNKDLQQGHLESAILKSLSQKESDHLAGNLDTKNTARNATKQGDEIKKLIFNPLPEIPEDMRYEAFNAKIVARFLVGINGEILKVELVSAANNPRLNALLVRSLKKWRFEASSKEFSEEIRVNFRVE